MDSVTINGVEYAPVKATTGTRAVVIDAWQPLYTAPPQRKPLTDQEAMVLWADVYEPGHHIWILAERFARAIEKAHGIGDK